MIDKFFGLPGSLQFIIVGYLLLALGWVLVPLGLYNIASTLFILCMVANLAGIASLVVEVRRSRV